MVGRVRSCDQLGVLGGRIPAIISIDVEPDGFQTAAGGAKATSGYDAVAAAVDRLRPRLAEATGRAPEFGWFFRMDPQIDAALGRADHLVTRFEDRVAAAVDAGDHLGLHTHPLRWSAAHDAWVHDVSDEAWTADLYASSFETFERAIGEPCRRHRAGGALFSQPMVDALQKQGALVESALEPVRGWGVEAGEVPTGVDASPLVGRNIDCSRAPTTPYWPSRRDFLKPDPAAGALALLPATTTWMSLRRPAWQTALGAAVRTRKAPTRRMLYPTSRLPPGDFWDLVQRQLRLMRRPYVNVGFRTDDPDSAELQRALAVLEGLAGHPLAQRIVVVDPLDALPQLLGRGSNRLTS